MEKNVIKKRKGFSFIELIWGFVIMGIAMAIAFAAGSGGASTAKSSVVQSDYHSFELAVTQLLMEHPEYIKLQSTSPSFTTSRLAEFNRYLPDSMALSGTSPVVTAKEDEWSQPYRVMFVTDNVNSSYFRVYIVSNGPNTENAGSNADADDLIMCIQLQNGDIKSKSWGFKADNAENTTIASLVP